MLLPYYPSKVATRAVKASILSSASCKALVSIGINALYFSARECSLLVSTIWSSPQPIDSSISFTSCAIKPVCFRVAFLEWSLSPNLA